MVFTTARKRHRNVLTNVLNDQDTHLELKYFCWASLELSHYDLDTSVNSQSLPLCSKHMSCKPKEKQMLG